MLLNVETYCILNDVLVTEFHLNWKLPVAVLIRVSFNFVRVNFLGIIYHYDVFH